MIHPDWLRAFAAFAETMSFTEAARRLHLTQPAVHGQVKKLAEALSTTLYLRRGRSLALTSGGERVLVHAREVIEREAALRGALAGADERPVTIAAGEGAFLYLLSDGIRAIMGRGDIGLRLMTTSAEAAVDALRTGRAQVAVAVLAEVPEDLEGHLLRRVSAKVVMPRGHTLGKRKRVHGKHLDGQPLLLPPRGRPHREAVLSALADAGASAEVVVEAHGWEVLMHYAGLGVGVAVVNGICRTPPGLTSRPFVGLPEASYWLLHRRGPRLREVVERVCDTLRAHVN